MEIKTQRAHIKEIDGRSVTGIANVFGNIDSYIDIVHKGAFLKTIKENGNRLRHLWQHDYFAPPIAVITNIREVGVDELPEHLQSIEGVEGGLEVTRKYLDTERGNEVLTGIKEKAIGEMSFAFDLVKWDFEEDENSKETIRHVREVRLWETSDVNWGANELTVAQKNFDHLLQFDGLKTRDSDLYLFRLLQSIKNVQAEPGGLKEESMFMLQQIKQEISFMLTEAEPTQSLTSPLQQRILEQRIQLALMEEK